MHFLPRGFLFPEALARAISTALFRAEAPSAAQVKQVGATLAGLWPKLAKDRGQATRAHYSFDKAESLAYAAYYLPANVMKVPTILAEAATLGLEIFGSNTKWLDIGSGPGTTALGLSWWRSFFPGPLEIRSLDQSPAALALGQTIQSELQHSLSLQGLKATWQKENFSRKPNDSLATMLAQKPDIISYVNSIAEILPDMHARILFLQSLTEGLLELCEADQKTRWILLVEPGSQSASRELLHLRDSLRTQKNLQILLPCLDNRPCGALRRETDWCHEEIACQFPDWVDALGKNAQLKKAALLFSYLLIAVGPNLESISGARMVSQRFERKGLLECWFCLPQGKEKLRLSNSVQKKRAASLPEPNRGDLLRTIDFDGKGEILAMERHDYKFLAEISHIFSDS